MKINLLTRLKDISINKKLYLITGIMLLLIILELFTLWLMIYFLSATRAYVGGEALWSKAQKNSTFYLLKYVDSHDINDYKRFLAYTNVTLGDKQARIELQKTTPNNDIAYQGFIIGLNQSDDIPRMIKLFTLFQHISYMEKAINLWTEADKLIETLVTIGDEIHQKITAGKLTSKERNEFIERIYAKNTQLTEMANNFSYALGDASRWLEELVLGILLGIAITVEVSGLLFTILLNVHIRKGLNEIIRVSKSIMRLDFSEKAKCFSQDEIGQLANVFNQMIDSLEKSINEQKILNKKMMVISREAGMADVATNILHNVGNILNSSNVSINLLTENVLKFEFLQLPKVAEVIKSYSEEQTITTESSEKIKLLPEYLDHLFTNWCKKRTDMLHELEQLNNNIEHIVEVIKIQKSLSNKISLHEKISLSLLLDEAILLSTADIEKHDIKIQRDYQFTKDIIIDKFKILQILINLIQNAKEALITSSQLNKELSISSKLNNNKIQIEIADNGIGIDTEKLTQIFSAGYSRKDGRGFNLHLSALTAEELGCSLRASSEGINKGALFILEIDLKKNSPSSE